MRTTKRLVLTAALLGGMLATIALDKSIVAFPAWRQVGPVAWADFTRAAELGRGLILYPLQGISALLCSIAAAVALGFNRASARSATVAAYAAAALAVAALIVTRYRVAPSMLTLNRIGDDPVVLERVFDQVRTWWTVKAALHALTFLANICTLAALGTRR